jgi:hypothetical protein
MQMNRFIPPFIVSFLTLGVVTQAKPVSERFICDAKDELIATVYNDPFFSDPRNHKSRDQLIMRILRSEGICPKKD